MKAIEADLLVHPLQLVKLFSLLQSMGLCRAKVTQFLGAKQYSKAPDGGWGWVVAVAFFLVEMFTYGIIKSFGIFLQDMMEEFGETNSRVSWIISICVFIMAFNSRWPVHLPRQTGCSSEKNKI